MAFRLFPSMWDFFFNYKENSSSHNKDFMDEKFESDHTYLPMNVIPDSDQEILILVNKEEIDKILIDFIDILYRVLKIEGTDNKEKDYISEIQRHLEEAGTNILSLKSYLNKK